MMMTIDYKVCNWLEIKEDVFHALPETYTALASLGPDEQGHNKLYLTDYQYGDTIYHQGQWRMPSTCVEQTKRPVGLRYSSLPLGLVLTRRTEQFIQQGHRIIPLSILSAGQWIGLTETLRTLREAQRFQSTKSPYDITAGARSLFLLPPLKNQAQLQQLLRHHQLDDSLRITHIFDQQELFRRLYRKSQPASRWTCRILWFDESWIRHPPFQHFLYMQAFQPYLVKTMVENQKLFQALYCHRMISPYVVATLIHLLHITTGYYPGFQPQVDEELAPTRQIQAALMAGYSLPYLPTLMGPCQMPDDRPVYYSCYIPTLPQTNDGSHPRSYMDFLRMLAELIPLLNDDRTACPLPDITAFHSRQDVLGLLQSSQLIVQEDPSFLEDKHDYPKLDFCETNRFFKGCFRIG